MKRILVVGATSAIATACARRWAAQKAEFFLVARDAVKLEQAAADLSSRGAAAVHTHALDLNQFEAHPGMLDGCQRALGGLDLALVAHGTLPDQRACEQDVDLALREFSTNGLSVIALLTLLANRFEEERRGVIAVISSVAGDRGRPSNYLYGAAKGSVTVFCEGMRARMSKVGVHVLTIKPGFVDTPMTRGLPLPTLLAASPAKVADSICRAVERKSNSVYVPAFWAAIMLMIKSIPDPIFKRLNL